jgi:hypothetical protein
MELKKFRKLIETFNTYYSFALILYAAALYLAAHHHMFWLIAGLITPILSGWGGYLLYAYLEQRDLRHGFRIITDSMTLEVGDNGRYKLHYLRKLKAGVSHLMSYPISHQWTGSGEGARPVLKGKGQQILSLIDSEFEDKKGLAQHSLYYFVRSSMKKLELNVKFPMDNIPENVVCGFIKPTDTGRFYTSKGLRFDPDRQWVTWVIERPKRNYCYRIQW